MKRSEKGVFFALSIDISRVSLLLSKALRKKRDYKLLANFRNRVKTQYVNEIV